jgi:hypothetical protein
MAHLDLGDFSVSADLASMIARRRQRSLQLLASMCAASLAIVGFAALFLAATF